MNCQTLPFGPNSPRVCGEFHPQPRLCLGTRSFPTASGQSQGTATSKLDSLGVPGEQGKDRKPKSLPTAVGRQEGVRPRQDSVGICERDVVYRDPKIGPIT